MCSKVKKSNKQKVQQKFLLQKMPEIENFTFLKLPSIKNIFPLSTNAKTLDSSNSIARPYDYCNKIKQTILETPILINLSKKDKDP